MRTLRTGGMLSATVTAATMLASARQTGSPWAAVNAITHIVDGDGISQPNEYDTRASWIGLSINATAMLAWAAIHEAALVLGKQGSTPATGVFAAMVAYVIDYHIVPKRYTPGVEKKISMGSVYALYGVMALIFWASSAWNRDET